MRVLIADDHDLLRDTLELWFRQEKIDVVTARDLDSALSAVAAQEAFDLILLDHGMPGMDGLDGLSRALDGAKGARVALMSGTAPREVAERALEMGAAGFLPKTLSAKSLVNAVRFMAMGEQYAPHRFHDRRSRGHPGQSPCSQTDPPRTGHAAQALRGQGQQGNRP